MVEMGVGKVDRHGRVEAEAGRKRAKGERVQIVLILTRFRAVLKHSNTVDFKSETRDQYSMDSMVNLGSFTNLRYNPDQKWARELLTASRLLLGKPKTRLTFR